MNKTNFCFYWLLLSYYPTISNKLILWNFNLSTLIRYNKFKSLFILTHLNQEINLSLSNKNFESSYSKTVQKFKGGKKIPFHYRRHKQTERGTKPINFSFHNAFSKDLDFSRSLVVYERFTDRSIDRSIGFRYGKAKFSSREGKVEW